MNNGFDYILSVQSRPRIGHTRHSGKTSKRSGSGASGNRLFVLKSWFTQMDVHIHPSRRHICFVAFGPFYNLFTFFGGQPLPYLNDNPVLNSEVDFF